MTATAPLQLIKSSWNLFMIKLEHIIHGFPPLSYNVHIIVSKVYFWYFQKWSLEFQVFRLMNWEYCDRLCDKLRATVVLWVCQSVKGCYLSSCSVSSSEWGQKVRGEQVELKKVAIWKYTLFLFVWQKKTQHKQITVLGYYSSLFKYRLTWIPD